MGCSRYRAVGRYGTAYYHVVSRVVDRRVVFGDREKVHFRWLLEGLLGFSGLRCVTYCLMGNHFHLLLEVPVDEGERFRSESTDEELLERAGRLYSESVVASIRAELGAFREAGDARGAERLRQRYLSRMYDLSRFVQELKGRFARWFNREHGRRGAFWEERFRSVLLEDRGGDADFEAAGTSALLMVAAYIDLNPIRAGLVEDPRHYRFCGYAEAVAGAATARSGLSAALGERGRGSWREVHAAYRRFLYHAGAERAPSDVEAGRHGFTDEQVREVERRSGELTLAEALRCRVRYFTDGFAIGSREFIEGVFRSHRQCFGAARDDGARPMRLAEWGGNFSLRELRESVLAFPDPRSGRASAVRDTGAAPR